MCLFLKDRRIHFMIIEPFNRVLSRYLVLTLNNFFFDSLARTSNFTFVDNQKMLIMIDEMKTKKWSSWHVIYRPFLRYMSIKDVWKTFSIYIINLMWRFLTKLILEIRIFRIKCNWSYQILNLILIRNSFFLALNFNWYI